MINDGAFRRAVQAIVESNERRQLRAARAWLQRAILIKQSLLGLIELAERRPMSSSGDCG